MFDKAYYLQILGLACLSPIIAIQLTSNAQVIPDASLNSVVNQTGSVNQITGGTARGSNIFHSFREFSLNSNETATFVPGNNIVNILSRVTGGNPSNILGNLGVSGNANLFFLNPSGILFGSNSRLDISGSFLASTASKFVLNSGNTQLDFLDIDSIPQNLTAFNSIDMSFAGESGSVSLINDGHTITESSPFVPHTQNTTPGLTVPPGQTLGLFGSGVTSNGGVLSAPAGNLVVGSIQQGTVNVQQLNGQLNFDVGGTILDNISLRTRTLFDASAGGSIRVYGSTVDLLEGSTVLVENLFNQSGGSIDVTATESLNIVGVSPLTIFRSSISGETIGTGLAPTINVQVNNLSILDGGIIGIRNFIASSGGVINVNASESIRIVDSFTPSPTLFSSIASITTSTGPSADINITTENLSLLNGGDIGSSTFGPGSSGNVAVNALESLNISGFTPIFFAPSTINAASFGMGDAGNVVVETGVLRLFNGGSIGTTALAQGSAGNIDVVATESITLAGFAGSDPGIPQNLTPSESSIDSSASINPPLQAIFDLPPVPSGDSGQVNVSTPNLVLRDGARISVLNQGQGTDGNLMIESENINLFNTSLFSAATASGDGGNISVLAKESLILDSSSITASAQGFGAGGNVDIDAGVIVLSNNSQFSGNAIQASGGNISLDTQGLFISNDSDITASSELGVQFDGTVAINSPNIDFTNATLDLAVRPEIERVKTSCNIGPGEASSEYTRPGSGGIGSNPDESGEYSIAASSQRSLQSQEYYLDPETGQPEKYPNVVGWKHNPDGTIAMTSDPKEAVQTKAFCSKTVKNTL